LSEADKLLVVGIGNAFRSDDGVGPFVAEALLAKGHPALVHAGDGTGLMDLFQMHGRLVLVDATRSGTEPGTMVSFDALVQKLPAELFHYSTHRFGLAEAVETARALGSLPNALTVYGIEGGNYEAGTQLSEAVREAAGRLIEELAGTLSDS
jgi:hydrogenase maturation protease